MAMSVDRRRPGATSVMNRAVPIDIGRAMQTATSAISDGAGEDGGDAEPASVRLPGAGREEREAGLAECRNRLDREEETDGGHDRQDGEAREQRPAVEDAIA